MIIPTFTSYIHPIYTPYCNGIAMTKFKAQAPSPRLTWCNSAEPRIEKWMNAAIVFWMGGNPPRGSPRITINMI